MAPKQRSQAGTSARAEAVPGMEFFSRISAHGAQGKLTKSDLRKAQKAFETMRDAEKDEGFKPKPCLASGRSVLDKELLDCNSEKKPKANGKKPKKPIKSVDMTFFMP